MSIDSNNIASEAFESGAFDSLEIPGFDDPPKEEKEEAAPVEAAAAEEATEPAEEPAEAAAESETPAAQAAAVSKALTFRAGDKEVALDETATIPWKIDGKQQAVTVKDLLDNYSGKVAWDKRFNEVATQRKQLTTEKMQLEQARSAQQAMIRDLHEKATAGKPFEAVQTLLKMTGTNINPREYVSQLRASLLEQAQKLASMTDAERAAYEINEEREQLKAERDNWKQQREAEQAQEALKTRVVAAIQESGLDTEQFVEASSRYAELVKARGGDPNQIQPEHVVSHIRMTDAYEVARDAIAELEPDLVRDGTVIDDAKWDKLAQLKMANPDISKAEFVELYRQVRAAKAGKVVAKKIAKAPVATVATASAKTKPKAVKTDDYSSITADDLKW